LGKVVDGQRAKVLEEVTIRLKSREPSLLWCVQELIASRTVKRQHDSSKEIVCRREDGMIEEARLLLSGVRRGFSHEENLHVVARKIPSALGRVVVQAVLTHVRP
jgi:hypothetical protein